MSQCECGDPTCGGRYTHRDNFVPDPDDGVWRYASNGNSGLGTTGLLGAANANGYSVKGKLMGIYVRAASNQDALIRIGSGGDLIRVVAGEAFNLDCTGIGPSPVNPTIAINGTLDGAVASWVITWSDT